MVKPNRVIVLVAAVSVVTGALLALVAGIAVLFLTGKIEFSGEPTPSPAAALETFTPIVATVSAPTAVAAIPAPTPTSVPSPFKTLVLVTPTPATQASVVTLSRAVCADPYGAAQSPTAQPIAVVIPVIPRLQPTPEELLSKPWRRGIWQDDQEQPWGTGIQAIALGFDYSTLFASFSYNDGRSVLYKSEDTGTTWRLIKDGPTYAGTLTIDTDNPEYLYGQESRGKGLYQSSDSGDSWSSIEAPGRVVFASGDLLYATSDGALFCSSDHAETWREISTLNATLVVVPHYSSILYKYKSGTLHMSKDGGLSWSPLAPPDGGWPGRLLAFAVNRADPPTLYLGIMEKGLAATNAINPDGWSTRSWPPDVGAIRTLAFHPTNADVMALTSDQGVFATYDGGASWVPLHEAGHRIGNVVYQDLPAMHRLSEAGEGLPRPVMVTSGSPWTICVGAYNGVWCHRGVD